MLEQIYHYCVLFVNANSPLTLNVVSDIHIREMFTIYYIAIGTDIFLTKKVLHPVMIYLLLFN